MRKIQHKLVSLLIKTSVIPLLVLGAISIFAIQQIGLREARERVYFSLERQVSIYRRAQDRLKYLIHDMSHRVSPLLDDDQFDLLRNEFASFCRKNHLDFLELTDKRGRIIISISNPAAEGTDIGADKFVKKAFAFQTTVSTELLGAGELARLGLSDQAAVVRGASRENLALKVSTPVLNRNEMVIGTLQAGYLLTNSYEHFLNDIKRQSGLNPSIFLGNVRIASTIPPERGENPIGKTMDIPAVRQVFETGQRHVSRTHVVGQYHQAAFEPLFDSENHIVGMFAIGIPESRIFALRNELVFFFGCALLAALLLSFAFGARDGGRIVRSIKKLRAGVEAFGRDDLLYRVEIRSGDELEELGNFFNLTMSQLLHARKQIEDCSLNIDRLEDTVHKSTLQLEKAEQKLVEFERMAAMGRMATALSHELRNTFAEINSGLYALKLKLAEAPADVVDTVATLRVSLDHATKILSDVLSFSYPRKPILSNVDINYLIDDLLAMPAMKEMFRKNGIRVDKSAQGDIPAIPADGLQLREMFTNIVVNAVQAMEKGGTISIFLTQEAGGVRVSISDTGLGMSPEAMKSLFTPFFTTKSRGLGLGLPIARTIVQEHGGTIDVSSKQGRGTVFVVTIPTARQDAAV